MIRLLLVDDHPLVRLGLSALFGAEDDMEVVAQAESVAEALDRLAEHEVDVAFVDIAMPGGNGLSLLKRAAHEYPDVKIIMLSVYAEDCCVVDALRSGAAGYVLKGALLGEVVQAARTVMTGRRYLSAVLAERAIDGYLEGAGPRPEPAKEAAGILTDREADVVRLLCSGMSKRTVAKELFISVRTVETHRANAMRKLDLHSQVDLVRYAVWSGLISVSGAGLPTVTV